MAVKPRLLIDRLMARVVENINGCWIFTGARTSGYGVLGTGSRGTGLTLAHRATYDYFIGDVPRGLDLDHLCRVRECCNPWHLEPVTRSVNNLRIPPRTACRRGHPYDETTPIARGTGQHVCLPCGRIRYQQKKDAA